MNSYYTTEIPKSMGLENGNSIPNNIITGQNRVDRVIGIPQNVITIQNTYSKAEVAQTSSSQMQYMAVMAINVIAFAHGFSVGWISPYLSLLQSNDSPVGPITNLQISYIGALLCLGAVVGTFMYGAMADLLGRKVASLALAVPLIGWSLSVLLGNQVQHLYIGRTLAGLSAGGVFVLVPLYIAEISEDSIRGKLGSYFIMSINFGILLAFVAGSYLDYYIVARFMLAQPFIFLIVFAMLPETPHHLIKCGKFRDAEKSLYFLRGCSDSPMVPEKVQLELEKISINLNNNTNNNLYPNLIEQQTGKFWEIFNSIADRRAIMIGIVLVVVNQMSGVFALISYTSAVFEEAGSNLSPNASSIVIAIIQLLGSYVSTLAIDRVPRKLLYSMSAFGTVIGLVLMGVHGYLRTLGFNFEIFSGVPIASLSFVIFISSVGILPLTFIILSEILPQEIRSLGTSLCTALLWIFSYILLRYFSSLVLLIGLHGSMFVFAISVLLGMIFVMIFVPETMGKSFDEIRRELED